MEKNIRGDFPLKAERGGHTRGEARPWKKYHRRLSIGAPTARRLHSPHPIFEKTSFEISPRGCVVLRVLPEDFFPSRVPPSQRGTWLHSTEMGGFEMPLRSPSIETHHHRLAFLRHSPLSHKIVNAIVRGVRLSHHTCCTVGLSNYTCLHRTRFRFIYFK